ncbi:NAD(P)-dependent oxidoreductase [Saccharopolyspora sp. WRP15-2]|uniref:NAD(P)-dependent oxidoreductase n=1 Tax=Saccharopolyspora oryzae TaxID=2997343 RepID=A0ABT4UZA4_9PSEU|nr:NAD(P)-dependent oxidoreductase [Saccharopolyspora oryzae]MDA3627028.1 NAD(P)-dependent oxidoreductase [Saccharopolyspora oryzae]
MVVAGSTGVIGRALLPMLRERGHHVTALVRGVDRLDGSAPFDDVAVADLQDLDEVQRELRRAAPDVVVDQTSGIGRTDLSDGQLRSARTRERASKNLVEAAVEAGAQRIIGQSTTAAYLPHGHDVLDEESPLWTDAPGCWGDAVRAQVAVEEAVLDCPDIEGVALRYGNLYGPGTQYAPGGAIHSKVCGSQLPVVADEVGLTSFTHVDDAAGAVLELLASGDPGAYNVVDNEPAAAVEWLPAYALMAGGPAPVSLTLEQAKAQLDWLTVHQLTEQRGATNFRLRETLGWRPKWPSWREGFADLFGHWPG